MPRSRARSTKLPLTVVRLEAIAYSTDRHHVDSEYVTRYWLPLLGPSATALMRLVAREEGAEYGLDAVAAMIGLGTSLGTLERTIGRLRQFSLGDLLLDPHPDDGDNLPGRLRARVTLGDVGHRLADKLPQVLRDELVRYTVSA